MRRRGRLQMGRFKGRILVEATALRPFEVMLWIKGAWGKVICKLRRSRSGRRRRRRRRRQGGW
jgi:hypothetical protein